MLRTSHFPPLTSPVLYALRLSSLSSLVFHSPSRLTKFPLSAPFRTYLLNPFMPNSSSLTSNQVPAMVGYRPSSRPLASMSSTGSSGRGREILVQHLLVKETDLKLLLDLQQRVSTGEDLSDLAVEFSICPSKDEGGMLGWVRKGQMEPNHVAGGMGPPCYGSSVKDFDRQESRVKCYRVKCEVPEFEDAAFNAPLNKVTRCKTKFGWHLLQVLSEREESLLLEIQPEELHGKMQDPSFLHEAQFIDVREPDEVAKAALPAFQVLPLRQFGSWGPEITSKLDPHKDTYVMCHHGARSMQVAKWLQTQGFRRIFNVSGGIHAYSLKADPSIPTY